MAWPKKGWLSCSSCQLKTRTLSSANFHERYDELLDQVDVEEERNVCDTGTPGSTSPTDNEDRAMLRL